MNGTVQISQVKKGLWFLVFAVASILIFILGFAQLCSERTHVYTLWGQELTSVGTLKASQISVWRKERLADAIRFAQGPTLTRAIDRADPEDLRLMLNLNRKEAFYEDALLVSPVSDILYSASPSPEPLGETSRQAVGRAIATHKSALSDIYKGKDGLFRIDVAAPVKDTSNKPVAAFVLRCAAADYLYPLIESWPGPSKSAETLIVRREGDTAVSLNMVRHKSDTALNLRLPLAHTHLPAVKALLGTSGIVHGTDYRGEKVLADVRPIPQSDWFIVTKVDKREILHDFRIRALIIFGFVVLGVLLAAATVAYVLRNKQAALFQSLYRAEQEQRLANQKFRTILYSIGDAVITTDEEGCVQQMNPVAEQLTGWAEAEAQGLSLDEVFKIVHEETRIPVQNPVFRVLREGQIVGLANHTTLISRQGKEFPISDSGAPIRDSRGEIAGVVLVFRDQSAERAAQKTLAERERQLSTLTNNLPGIVYRCHFDTYWTMTFISKGCKELTGYEASDLIDNAHTSYFDLIHPEDRQYVWDMITRLIKEQRTFTLEYRITTADGAEKWVWERGCAVIKADGSIEAIEGFITDITKTKLAAIEQADLEDQLRQSQKLEAIGRLAGGLAHDFNNTLSVILGNAELAGDQLGASSPVHTELTEILKAGKHATALVSQLLGFASKQPVKPRGLDLNATIEKSCLMLKNLLGESIDLAWVPGKDIWPVWVDPSQIDQILMNLTINARDAISGKGRITLATDNIHLNRNDGNLAGVKTAGDYVRITVSDTGCGMDTSTQAQIFEPFFTTKPQEIGTGMGLPTVYGIIKQNSGFIHVDSQPGKGTRFQIDLPRYRDAHEHAEEKTAAAPVAPPPPAADGDAPNKTILIAEDEPAVLSLTKTLLKRMGYNVLAANSPQEAIQISRAHKGHIDLLLSDVVMPEMNGRELYEQLILERPTLKSLFMSGYTANIITNHGIINTGVNFIQKPFTRETFTAMVREALSS